MALLRFNFQSDCLGNNTEISVILPDKAPGVTPESFYGSGKKYKVLWLLHGTFGDHTDWLRKSNVELYACERELAVVMFSGLNSNYVNWGSFATGYRPWDFLFDELMPLVYGWLPISDRREDNFIAGLSMGGNGAMQYAMGHPEKFAGVASLSNAPTDLRAQQAAGYDGKAEGDAAKLFNRRVQNLIDNFGGIENYVNSPLNIWDRLTELNGTGKLPKLFFCCGTKDTLIWDKYVNFKAYAKQIGLDAAFWEAEGYTHEWRFWDLSLQRALDYFGL